VVAGAGVDIRTVEVQVVSIRTEHRTTPVVAVRTNIVQRTIVEPDAGSGQVQGFSY
jgi:hypothetical protein